jgi:hypothetical protein
MIETEKLSVLVSPRSVKSSNVLRKNPSTLLPFHQGNFPGVFPRRPAFINPPNGQTFLSIDCLLVASDTISQRTTIFTADEPY